MNNIGSMRLQAWFFIWGDSSPVLVLVGTRDSLTRLQFSFLNEVAFFLYHFCQVSNFRKCEKLISRTVFICVNSSQILCAGLKVNSGQLQMSSM